MTKIVLTHFEIGHVLQAVLVHLCYTVEHPIWMIESSVAEAQHQLRELPHQIEQHKARSGVVTAVKESKIKLHQ